MRHVLFGFLLALIIPRSGYSWPIERIASFPGSVQLTIDPFGAMTNNEVDLLFVIDGSGSMADDQARLAQHIDALMAPLKATHADIHAAVLTMDVEGFGGHKPGELIGGYLTSQSPALVETLAQRLNVGTNDSANEQMFASVMAALSPPLLETVNKGFLRPSANLAIIFVTDAEDQSPNTPAQFVSFLTDLKGGDKTLIKLGAIYVPQTDTACPRDAWDPPIRLDEALAAFTSVTAGLCDLDYREKVGNIGGVLIPEPTGSEIRSVVLPSEAAFDSITVNFGTQSLMAGDASEGWIYAKAARTVTIGPDFNFRSEPYGTKLLINYVPKEWK